MATKMFQMKGDRTDRIFWWRDRFWGGGGGIEGCCVMMMMEWGEHGGGFLGPKCYRWKVTELIEYSDNETDSEEGEQEGVVWWWRRYSNTEYRNLRRINVHAHLPIVFDCREVILIVVTSSKYVGNFDHKSNLAWSFEQVFLRFTDSSKLSQLVN